MSVALPKGIRIGPFAYKVVSKRAELNQRRVDYAERDLVGQCDHRELTIAVDSALAPAVQRETLLHEVMHAIYALVGAEGQKLTEEETILRIVPSLLDTLQRNPELAAFMLEVEG